VPNSGGDGLTRRVGETTPRYDSQAVSEGRHGGDSPLTWASVVCQSIKCSGRGSGCGSGGPARASSEVETHPRGRSALERGGDPPEGASSPRAWRSLARGGVQPSSEVEFRRYSAVPLERSGVSPEGCWGRPPGGPLRLPGPLLPSPSRDCVGCNL
jgi:hypothetical protein